MKIPSSSIFSIQKILFLIAALVLLLIQDSNAFATEAGHCSSGDLRGKKSGHGENGSGSLSNGLLQVTFDSVPLEVGSVLTLNPNQEYTVRLDFIPDEKTSISLFKGFLFRLSSSGDNDGLNAIQNDTFYVGDDDKVQEKTFGCADGVSAMTHTNSNGKRSVEFNFDYVGEGGARLLLEVTVVLKREANNWHYDAYDLEITS
jgi:hypothetical protein